MNQIKRFARALLFLIVGGGLAGPAGGTAQTTSSPARLTLSEAQAIVEAAQRDAAGKNLRLSIAVVDGRGDLIAATRMESARATTMDTAIGKAMGAAIFGRPSADLAERSDSPLSRNMNEAAGGRLRFFQGAVPIVRDGYTVGAVGASGASSQDDEDNVKAALASVGL